MKRTWQIMGMPVTLSLPGSDERAMFRLIRDYFRYVDEQYSPFKPSSQVSRINAGLPRSEWSKEMKAIWQRAAQTKRATNGYFDVMHQGRFDPSGLVKGWAIGNAARLLRRHGIQNFYVEAGGDIQVKGRARPGQPWRIGIRNPFDRYQNIKVVELTDQAIATSGTAIRGQHIYNPHGATDPAVVSLTVIGPTIYDADRFATAAFAMGRAGINFIESLPGFEAYMVTDEQRGTLTTGFERYEAVVT